MEKDFVKEINDVLILWNVYLDRAKKDKDLSTKVSFQDLTTFKKTFEELLKDYNELVKTKNDFFNIINGGLNLGKSINEEELRKYVEELVEFDFKNGCVNVEKQKELMEERKK